MNLFNRILVFVLLLAVAAGAIAIATLAWTIPDDTIDWLRDAVDWMDENDGDTEKALLTAAALLVALITLTVLALEVLPRSSSDVRVTDLQGAEAVLSTSAVAQRLEDALRQVPNVSDARAFVRSRRKGVEVSMDLHVDPDANLADVTEAASQTARHVLSNRMHVELVSLPKARLHYRELRLRRAAPAPAGDTAAVAAPPQAAEPAPPPEAEEAGLRPPVSPDNTEAPSTPIDAPPSDPPAKSEPETENKFE